MSCNGCRVLRKGCSESCVLRTCLQWIESPEAQGHATVFVAKFFGRAGLMSFISAVPESHRPALFQSLLFEACGRTINPVTGAVGLLWTSNWHVCQAAVDTVLRGGCLRPMPELEAAADLAGSGAGDGAAGLYGPIEGGRCVASTPAKKRKGDPMGPPAACDLDLCLTPRAAPEAEKALQWRPTSPSMTSEGSVTTCAESAVDRAPRLLNLFV